MTIILRPPVTQNVEPTNEGKDDGGGDTESMGIKPLLAVWQLLEVSGPLPSLTIFRPK